jgi:hypothetical protein
MSKFSRRDFLKTTAGAAAAGTLGAGSAMWSEDALAQSKWAPEKGAKLRVLRWKRFVQGDEDMWLANTKKFAEMHKIEVRVDSEGWEDVRPKAAVAANVGSGPDVIISTFEDAHQYPDKLVDVSDLANYLGNKYGGWYEAAKAYGQHDKKWVAIMMGAAGATLVGRQSQIKAAGFDAFPRDFPGFLKFMVLGYLMVLIEEVFAALVNHLSEGFFWPLFLLRIGQFWALNLFAFTGFFVGWYLLARFIGYSRVEMFFLGGCFGLYSERVVFLLPQGQLLQFILFAPLIIFTYGLILTPAVLSLGESGKPRLIWLLRYPLAFLAPFLCSIPPLVLLNLLRGNFPDWFPPRKFIP